MNEKVKERARELFLDEADELKNFPRGSEEYSNVTKMLKELGGFLNESDRIEKEFVVNSIEEKKNKKEFIGKIAVAALSIGVPIVVSIMEANGLFIKFNFIKPIKF